MYTQRALRRVKGFPDPSLSQYKTSGVQMCLLQQQMETSRPCLGWVKSLRPPSPLCSLLLFLALSVLPVSALRSVCVFAHPPVPLSYSSFVHRTAITWTDCLFVCLFCHFAEGHGHLQISSYFTSPRPPFAIGVFDNCSHSLSEKGWSVGIRTVDPSGTRDARFYYTLRTDRAVKSTTVYSHQRYRTSAWTHLMATYNGHNMTLYVDGAKVCGFRSFWSNFSNPSNGLFCYLPLVQSYILFHFSVHRW